MKKIYRNDVILNLIIILLCICTPIILSLTSKDSPKAVVISHDGDVERVVSLSENCSFHTHGVEITIENGTQRFDGQVFDSICYSILKSDYERTNL